MNETHSRAIVYLLAAILCVMVFGASAFLTGLAGVAGVGAVLGVVFVVVAAIAKFFSSLRNEVTSAREARRPWLWFLVFLPGFFGNLIVCGLAALRWMDGGIRYRDALGTVPYWWVPVVIMFAGMVVVTIESAQEWLPKVPGRAATLFRGWLMLFVGPVFAPIGRWQSIRDARSKGVRIGMFSMVASIIGTFAVSIVLWVPAVFMPLVIITVLIIENLR